MKQIKCVASECFANAFRKRFALERKMWMRIIWRRQGSLRQMNQMATNIDYWLFLSAQIFQTLCPHIVKSPSCVWIQSRKLILSKAGRSCELSVFVPIWTRSKSHPVTLTLHVCCPRCNVTINVSSHLHTGSVYKQLYKRVDLNVPCLSREAPTPGDIKHKTLSDVSILASHTPVSLESNYLL